MFIMVTENLRSDKDAEGLFFSLRSEFILALFCFLHAIGLRVIGCRGAWDVVGERQKRRVSRVGEAAAEVTRDDQKRRKGPLAIFILAPRSVIGQNMLRRG